MITAESIYVDGATLAELLRAGMDAQLILILVEAVFSFHQSLLLAYPCDLQYCKDCNII